MHLVGVLEHELAGKGVLLLVVEQGRGSFVAALAAVVVDVGRPDLVHFKLVGSDLGRLLYVKLIIT